MPIIPKVAEVEGGCTLTFGRGSSIRTCFKPDKPCKKCPLYYRLRILPDLEEYRDVLFVGEGPGGDERIKMMYFTGSAGIILREVERDTLIEPYGLGHHNVIQCEGSGGLKDNDPAALQDAIECCSELLFDDIARLKPKLLVALGNLPKSVLIPWERKGIGSCHGVVYKDRELDILAAYHPAYILYHSKMFEYFWDDINEVRLFFTEKPGPFIHHMATPDTIEHLKGFDELYIDTETTSFSPYDSGEFEARGKKFHYGKMLCLCISGDGLNSYIFTPKNLKEYHKELKGLLETIPITCFHGQFDVPFIYDIGIFPYLKHDPMLMHYSMDESPSHSLKRLSRRFLGIEDWSEELQQYLPDRYTSYANIPPKKLYPYCGQDTAILKPLKETINERMTEDDKRIYETVLMPSARMFVDVRHRGIRIDVGRVLELKEKWAKERFELIRVLKEFGVKNANSPYQISDVLRELEVVDYDAVTLKLQMIRYLVECRLNGNKDGEEFIDTVIKYREVDKALTTFLRQVAEFMSEKDLCIHPGFKLFGTVTGRLTAEEPSLLNYPHTTRFANEIRSVFISFPGYVWGHWDQKQFELRVYAVVNDDKGLKDVLRDPTRDPHAETGWKCLGREVYEERNRLTKGQTRTAIKAVSFGRIYLRGAESIADQLEMPIWEAQVLCNEIDKMWPDIIRYRAWAKAQLDDFQELINPLGRRRRFPLLTPENYHESLTQACNFPIQSTASDLNLLGMVKLHNSEERKAGLLYPLFPVHDAIEFNIKEECVDTIKELITNTLARVPRDVLGVTDMPFDTDFGIGDTWAEASLSK